MPRIIECGYADIKKDSCKIKIEDWETPVASRINYTIGKGYGPCESSNGKKAGIYEIAHTEACADYRGGQFIDLQDFARGASWLIDPLEISQSDSILTMIASEEILARDWNTPEEDEAWANL